MADYEKYCKQEEIWKDSVQIWIDDQSTTENKLVICNKFNDFFVNIGPNLARKIPEVLLNLLQYMGLPIQQSLFL